MSQLESAGDTSALVDRVSPPVVALDLISAFPDAVLCAAYLLTWFYPTALGPRVLAFLVMVALLEFVVMHSAPFSGLVALSALRRSIKVLALGGLGALYMLFAWSFSASFGTMWGAVSFFGLMLNRVLGVLIGQVPRGEQTTFMGAMWVICGVTYLFGIAFAAMAPIPRFGITDAVIESQHFTVGGLLTEQPHRTMAFGALYFGVVALWELTGRGIVHRMRRARTRP